MMTQDANIRPNQRVKCLKYYHTTILMFSDLRDLYNILNHSIGHIDIDLHHIRLIGTIFSNILVIINILHSIN